MVCIGCLGNNIFGADIRTLLKNIGSSQEREKYILMERIQAPSVPGVIWVEGKGSCNCSTSWEYLEHTSGTVQ